VRCRAGAAVRDAPGFSIISINIVEKVGGLNGSKICMQIVVVRRITILLLRFFLPLSRLSRKENVRSKSLRPGENLT